MTHHSSSSCNLLLHITGSCSKCCCSADSRVPPRALLTTLHLFAGCMSQLRSSHRSELLSTFQSPPACPGQPPSHPSPSTPSMASAWNPRMQPPSSPSAPCCSALARSPLLFCSSPTSLLGDLHLVATCCGVVLVLSATWSCSTMQTAVLCQLLALQKWCQTGAQACYVTRHCHCLPGNHLMGMLPWLVQPLPVKIRMFWIQSLHNLRQVVLGPAPTYDAAEIWNGMPSLVLTSLGLPPQFM